MFYDRHQPLRDVKIGALSDIEHILFYGTLRRGRPMHGRLGLTDSLRFRGLRTIEGRIHDLGDYPGFVPGAGGVLAELFRIERPAILARLDRYEGYDPANSARSLFVRTATRVPRFAHGSALLDAWIYVYNGPIL